MNAILKLKFEIIVIKYSFKSKKISLVYIYIYIFIYIFIYTLNEFRVKRGQTSLNSNVDGCDWLTWQIEKETQGED